MTASTADVRAAAGLVITADATVLRLFATVRRG